MEDTTKTEATLEEMLRDAKVAEEPGEMAENPVIHKGDADLETPMIGIVKSAGYTWLYDTQTGVPSRFNNNMLPRALRKKRLDGTYVFGTVQRVKPKQGTFKCMLHKEDSQREHHDAMGFVVCPKDNLSSPFHVRRHMMKKHKVEWGAIEQERIDGERKEDRDFQKLLMTKALGETKEEKAPLYVSKKDRAK